MKTAILIAGSLLLTVTLCRGATNDAASVLQKGLFEEEANQNLAAAIQAYRTVASEFEKDRKLAATAIFRLGECYRKQGATNDAVVQYEKVLRDFSDQTQLATLSRQQLRAFGASPAAVAATEAAPGNPVPAAAELAALEAQLAEMKKMSKELFRITLQQNFPNPVLTSLMQQLAQAEQSLAVATKEYGPQHAEVLKFQTLTETISKQIDAQTIAALHSLEIKQDALKKAVETLQAAAPAPANHETNGDQIATTLTATEAEEVKRIQAMIKDSPDLINAKDETARATTPLLRAAAADQLVVAQFLLSNGANVDAKDSHGDTPLHYAAGAGHKAMAELLLNHKADVQAVNSNHSTPLHAAAASGFRSVAELLLSRGADPNVRANSGATPLILASMNGFRSVAELLLAHGTDINAKATYLHLPGHPNSSDAVSGTALIVASRLGDRAMVELLLNNKAEVTATDESGYTSFHWAAAQGYVPVAAELLAHGAEVDVRGSGKDTQNWTPLHGAVNGNQKEMAEFLLKNQADPNARIGTTYGEGGPEYTPLLMATARVLPEIVDALLAAKADPNLGNGARTPLLNAMNNENLIARKQMVKSLLDHGAQVDSRDVEGNTPLLLAAHRGDQETAALLLAKQPDVNAQNKILRTPLQGAVLAGETRDLNAFVKMLLDAGADPNVRDHDGDTALHFAIRMRKPDLIELLLANKADPNIQNVRGQTPLDEVKQNAGYRASPGPYGAAGILIPDGPLGASPNPYGAVGIPRPIPARGQAAATPTSAPPSPPSIADLLRQHGALDDLPNTNRIVISRPSANYSVAIFSRSSRDWNQFTLFELIAVKYGLLNISAYAGNSPLLTLNYQWNPGAPNQDVLAFPDFAHVRIRHLAPDRKAWQERTVDLATAFQSGDCSANVPLQWGDVVEIPETDHLLNESWGGLSSETVATLDKCLARQVDVIIKGGATPLTLTFRPGEPIAPRSPGRRVAVTPTFMLEPFLRDSGLLLASSDLSRIKIKHPNPGTGQSTELAVNCADPGNRPDYWLRDGDRIEVPEKSAMTPSPVPGFPSPRYAPAIPSRPVRRPASPPPSSAPPAGLTLTLPPASPAPQVESEEAAVPTNLVTQTAQLPSGRLVSANSELFYSPSPDDAHLLEAGYQRDSKAQNKVSDLWEQRASADIPGRGGAAVVWTGKEMIVFGGEGMGVSYDDGARYDFAGNSWQTLPRKDAPSSRTGCSAVWSGKEMIVWGGFGGKLGNDTNRNDGARFNPAANTWKPVSVEGAPAARFDHNAVWTGKEMLIWGGYTDSHARYGGCFAPGHLDTGGCYNPTKDSWNSITAKGAPSARVGDGAVWSGKEMIIWGGGDATKALGDGARYNPSKNAWKPVTAKGAPGPRVSPVAVWTGKEMIVWGGSSREIGSSSVYFQDGARYNPDKDTWTPMSRTGAPKGRFAAAAVWTGTQMILWGGVNDAGSGGVSDSNRFLGTGALYNPETDTWTAITNAGAPSPRLASGVAAGDGLLLFGGYNGEHLNDTWFFSPKQRFYPYAKK